MFQTRDFGNDFYAEGNFGRRIDGIRKSRDLDRKIVNDYNLKVRKHRSSRALQWVILSSERASGREVE